MKTRHPEVSEYIASPQMLEWFMTEFVKTGLRLDMGKSCIRLNPRKPLPLELFAGLAGKMSCDEWISLYEDRLKPGTQA